MPPPLLLTAGVGVWASGCQGQGWGDNRGVGRGTDYKEAKSNSYAPSPNCHLAHTLECSQTKDRAVSKGADYKEAKSSSPVIYTTAPLNPSTPQHNRIFISLTPSQIKDRAVSKGTDYKEAKSNSQPNALETMSVTPGVTLRQVRGHSV